MKNNKSGHNIHLYPSDFLHESRIEKISLVMQSLNLFESIWLIGITKNDLAKVEEVSDKVTLYRVGKPTKQNSFFSKMLAFCNYYYSVFLMLFGVNIRCINAHSLSVLPLAVFLKLFFGGIVIYDTHELETETNSLKGLRKKFAKCVEYLFIKKVDKVFCVSNRISEWYAKTYRLPEPITILNSTEAIAFKDSNILRESFNLNASQKIFLYFGVLETGRGIELLLEAFNNETKSHNVMVFVGYGSLTEKIFNSDSFGRNIFHLPAVAKNEIPAIAASADVGICIVSPTCLSYNFCMPNKLFEYLAAGLPVIVSSCITLQEFINKNQIGSVLSELKSSEVMKKVEDLSNADLTAMKNRAFAVAQKYGWAVQERLLRKSYQNILKNKTA